MVAVGTGLYRDGAYVQVSYDGIARVPISVALYRQRGYRPPPDQLPSKADYEAAKFFAGNEKTC